jgi:predicted O-methyltransferase YrrM
MNIGVLINSHKKNEQSLTRTLESFNYSTKLVVVAGYNFRSIFRRKNTQFIQVVQNSFYFTSLIEIISNPIFVESWTHILTISDDMELGNNTLELCSIADPNADATAADPKSNLVLYKKEYLFSKKNFILDQENLSKIGIKQNQNVLYQIANNKKLFPAAKIIPLSNTKNYFPALQIIQHKKNDSLNSQVNMSQIFECYDTHDEFLYLWSIKEPEAQVLYDCVKKIQARKIVVVGAFKGVSTKVILQAIGDRQFDYIINIDPFFQTYHAGNNYYNDFMKAMENVYNGEIIVLKGFASTLGKEATQLTKDDIIKTPEYRLAEINDQIDLCFIDGDHHFPTCLEDFKLVWKKIRKNGIVLLHDIKNEKWEKELQLLLDYITKLPDAKLNIFYGIDGIGIVEKI